MKGRIYPGQDLGDTPIWDRRNIRNPFRGEEGATDAHKLALESVARLYPFPTSARVSESDVDTITGKVQRYVNRARFQSPGTSLQFIREMFSTQESLPDSFFDTILLRQQRVALLDGYETPAFQAHREIIVEGEPFQDFREIKQVRIQRVPDPQKNRSPREDTTPTRLQEYDATDIGPTFFWRQIFQFDWETSTIRDLFGMLDAMFSNGEAVNRALEKYVFVDNLTGNPAVTVDGTVTTLIANHTTARGINNDAATGGVPTEARLDSVGDKFAAATIDGEPIAKSYGYIIAQNGGEAYRDAQRVVSPISEKSPDNANNAANLYGRGRLFPYRVLGVDVITSGTTWYATMDFRRSPSLGFQMSWLRGMNTPQIIDLDGPNGSRQSRYTMSREFLVQIAGAGAWGDVVGVVKGN